MSILTISFFKIYTGQKLTKRSNTVLCGGNMLTIQNLIAVKMLVLPASHISCNEDVDLA